MINAHSALQTALEIRRRGWWPVILHPAGATVPSKGGPKTATGKEPIGLAWGKARPSDDDLCRSFSRHAGAGVGIMLGPKTGVIDLEVDGPEGEASLRNLCGGTVPATLGWSSRRGPHHLFAWDERLTALGKTKITLPQLPGLELRLGGPDAQMQSAVPPTVGEDGRPRRWNDCDVIAPLPEAALSFLEDAFQRGKPRESHSASPGNGKAAASAGSWFRKAVESEAGKVATTREGERHNALLSAACTLGGMLGHGYLTEGAVTAELTFAGQRAGLPDWEVAATIRDGLAFGKARPLPWPATLGRPEGSSQAWPALRLAELPKAPAFPVDVFPPPLRDFCNEAAAAIQAPSDFIGGAMLAVAGAAIGQSVNVSLMRTWHEPPLLFMILVARPGTAKTPAIRVVCRPLSTIDRLLREESAAARQAWGQAKKAHDKDDDKPNPGPEPPQRRAIVKDVTRESLVIILTENPRGVLCDPDEASGWVGSFNEYKGKGGSDRQFWLSVWSCAPVSVDRKAGREPYYVPHPFVGVVGGMPPSMLGSLSEERGRDDGFLDRCLFVFPDRDAFPQQRWAKAELSETAETDWAETVAQLHALPMIADPVSGRPRPFYVPLTPEAERCWAEWFDRHSNESDAPDFPDDLAGSWSKMRAHAARFALILSRLWLACDPTADLRGGPVDVNHVRGALALADYFKAQAGRARHETTGGIAGSDAKAVLSWIKRGRKTKFREADLMRDIRRLREKPQALTSTLNALAEVGVIRDCADAGTRGAGRRPTRAYEVHPDLHDAPENTRNTRNSADRSPESPISGISGIFRRDPDSDAIAEREAIQAEANPTM